MSDRFDETRGDPDVSKATLLAALSRPGYLRRRRAIRRWELTDMRIQRRVEDAP